MLIRVFYPLFLPSLLSLLSGIWKYHPFRKHLQLFEKADSETSSSEEEPEEQPKVKSEVKQESKSEPKSEGETKQNKNEVAKGQGQISDPAAGSEDVHAKTKAGLEACKSPGQRSPARNPASQEHRYLTKPHQSNNQQIIINSVLTIFLPTNGGLSHRSHSSHQPLFNVLTQFTNKP